MKLSELRPILKKLRAAGYERHRHFGGYRKIWEFGDLRYGHQISDYEILLLMNSGEVDLLIEHADRKAQYELKYVYGLGGL